MCDDVGDEVTTDLALIATGCPMALWVISLYLSGLADVFVDNVVLREIFRDMVRCIEKGIGLRRGGLGFRAL